MAIQQLIIHKLESTKDSSSLQAVPASQSLASSPSLELLLDDLLQTYNKKPQKSYGEFANLSDSALPTQLTQYLDGKQTFVQLTTELLTQLTTGLNEAGAINGGYVLFADYKLGLVRHLLICVLGSQHSVTVTDELLVQDSSYLDTTRVSLAARLNISDWQNKPKAGRYLSFLRPSGSKRLVEVLQRVMSACEVSNSKTDTKTVIEVVAAYCDNEASNENRQAVKQQVHDYCQSEQVQQEGLSLDNLASYISEAGVDEFAQFINTKDYDMSVNMTPESRALNKLVRYSGRSNGISISFDAHLLGDLIEYDETTEQLIIKAVPDSLKKQLKK